MAETETTLLANEQVAWHSDENAELVTQQGWKDPNDVIRDYSELQKSASGGVKIPTDESSPEELSAFYTKIGVPENKDGYEVEVPENVPMSQEMVSKLRGWALEAGTPKIAFDTVLKNYLQEMSEQVTRSVEVAKAELREEWKNDYDVNFEMADRFVTHECSDEFRLALIETGLNNHPVFVREFLSLAKKTATDKLIKGDTKGEKKEGYVPRYKDDPEMYRTGDDEESQKARQYFIDKGHVY